MPTTTSTPSRRTNLRAVTELLAREKYLSLMVEAGSRVNWTALESGVADKIFFYYAPPLTTPAGDAPVSGTAADFARFDGVNRLVRYTLNTDLTLNAGSARTIVSGA